MVSKPVEERINEAGYFLKQAEQMGDNPQVYDLCIACEGTLDSINVFVHDEEPWRKINEKNKDLNEMFNQEFKKRKGEIKNNGAYYVYCQQQKIEKDLLKWKCEQKLSFYDWLTRKYDL